MKLAFIVTSCIEVKNDYPLTYSKVRSHFTTDDRFRQTVTTLASLDALLKKDATIYLVDASEKWEYYRDTFCYQPNLKFVSVKDEFPEIYETVTTHKNKSVCECLLLYSFMKKYQDELLTYDFCFKFTGRYFLDSSFDKDIFNQYSTDKLFYKNYLEFEWQDWWRYEMIDLRAAQGNNKIRQYSTVLFGWGRQKFDYMLNLIKHIKDTIEDPDKYHYDIETLKYFYTRDQEDSIVHTDWMVYGFVGTDGIFFRY